MDGNPDRCCRCAGSQDVVLVAEPDWWLCRPCRDELGRAALAPMEDG